MGLRTIWFRRPPRPCGLTTRFESDDECKSYFVRVAGSMNAGPRVQVVSNSARSPAVLRSTTPFRAGSGSQVLQIGTKTFRMSFSSPLSSVPGAVEYLPCFKNRKVKKDSCLAALLSQFANMFSKICHMTWADEQSIQILWAVDLHSCKDKFRYATY